MVKESLFGHLRKKKRKYPNNLREDSMFIHLEKNFFRLVLIDIPDITLYMAVSHIAE